MEVPTYLQQDSEPVPMMVLKMVQLRSNVPGGDQRANKLLSFWWPIGQQNWEVEAERGIDSTACGSGHTIPQWIEGQLVPEINSQGEPASVALDAAAFHRANKALDPLRSCNLTPSLIPYSQRMYQSRTST